MKNLKLKREEIIALDFGFPVKKEYVLDSLDLYSASPRRWRFIHWCISTACPIFKSQATAAESGVLGSLELLGLIGNSRAENLSEEESAWVRTGPEILEYLLEMVRIRQQYDDDQRGMGGNGSDGDGGGGEFSQQSRLFQMVLPNLPRPAVAPKLREGRDFLAEEEAVLRTFQQRDEVQESMLEYSQSSDHPASHLGSDWFEVLQDDFEERLMSHHQQQQQQRQEEDENE